MGPTGRFSLSGGSRARARSAPAIKSLDVDIPIIYFLHCWAEIVAGIVNDMLNCAHRVPRQLIAA